MMSVASGDFDLEDLNNGISPLCLFLASLSSFISPSLVCVVSPPFTFLINLSSVY